MCKARSLNALGFRLNKDGVVREDFMKEAAFEQDYDK